MLNHLSAAEADSSLLKKLHYYLNFLASILLTEIFLTIYI
jgi:hypothetical protein